MSNLQGIPFHLGNTITPEKLAVSDKTVDVVCGFFEP